VDNDTKFCVIPVTCTIMQKNGAGLHTASSCFWDNSTDGSCTVRWENKTMYCIVSVFGLAIWTCTYFWKWVMSFYHNCQLSAV